MAIRKLFSESSPGTVTVSDSVVDIRPSDIGRSYLYLRNTGAFTVFLCFSNTNDAELNKGIVLRPNEIYEMDADKITDSKLTAICDCDSGLLESTTIIYLLGM